ncbi:zinc-dependent metalloprotease [Flavobacterium sp. N502540]|uniref:zinc-dependent metalloprotease n=1 Tax=Flavobacterium sp. N502540 TaxID=2986838 RepID=UPI0022254EB8|nr:zinc-dependent metalloprotease [Flavobacterium sp. N502540]
MKKKYIILNFISCLSGFMHAQQTEGSGVVSYPDNNVKVVGEKIFWSANPKTDNSSESDLLTTYYKGLYNRRNNYLSGIKGTIDKPGGYIKIEVHAYDSKRAGGLQLLTDDEKTFVTRPIYGVEITQSSPNAFSKTTKELNYEYWDHGLQRGKISSDDIKTLGAKSLNAVAVNCGNWAWNWLRAFSLVSSSCSLEIDEDKLIQLENQPVVVKISMKDATLIDTRVPALANNDNLKRIVKNEFPYLVINKVNVEILEAPDDNNPVSFYKDMVTKSFDWANKVYTARTGKTLPEAAVKEGAKIGNPRVVFKDINVVIRKGSQKAYRMPSIEFGGEDGDIDLKAVRDDGVLYIKYAHTFYGNDPEEDYAMGKTISKFNVESRFKKSLILISYREYLTPDFVSRNVGVPAHELGHYFRLKHTFEYGCREPNDGISDTPPAEILFKMPDYKNCIAPVQCDGKRRLIENIMDYSWDCSFMFTPGQAEVMRNSIWKDYPNLNTTQISSDERINIVPNITVSDLRVGPMKRSGTENKEDITEQKVEKSQNIGIYPNPVKDKLNVANVENEDYVIFSINGQQILSGRTQKGQIDVGTLPEGMYIIKIKNTNKRFIKE